ncbi:MAG: TolB family protein [Marinifilaceae bacterium]
MEKWEEIEVAAPIYPDYSNVTIPVNIAPLNFSTGKPIKAEFYLAGEKIYEVYGNPHLDIDADKWKQMLTSAANQTLNVSVYEYNQKTWVKYKPLTLHVSASPIDAYISYRLIEPGYEAWNEMGIHQRHLETFEEKTLFSNTNMKDHCVNCHSFNQYQGNSFMFHVRGKHGGTVMVNNDNIDQIDIRAKKTNLSGVYPFWHPAGDFIAFSSNSTHQAFHAFDNKRIEVYDLSSDLIVYDIKKNKVIEDKRLQIDSLWETFPTWSPCGNYLYFCRALQQEMPFQVKELKYGLYRIPFNTQKGVFQDSVECVISETDVNQSISFPRISPNGRFLMYTQAECGTFPIWHKEADIEMIDLSTGQHVDCSAMNSTDSESYHSWSSNGQWVVFSSRRDDGFYTRLYIAHIGEDGAVSKPFLLPQRNPQSNINLLRSYNIPEFSATPTQATFKQLETRVLNKAVKTN